ncbi:hypothetical protein DICPUDRAFT_157443 [Dictyostelium purpureum]|uniref:JmjC domain-containing protein n=1 Tax=Dictyostelium purpureum TaxID=5786 RepID=F0ZZ53_DICPU|nr:uncharacterized protein DICPUDRAFT_157443 [Dictyostelium purpureum]EGC30777.1 hypothetical protein DICPUDRAFT_157443 [Dictyostelium purpureum]|eukprot:XP_003292693.1 hypothetical protein DICPUDRAFT_157443 [Dictyostelium purpureum]
MYNNSDDDNDDSSYEFKDKYDDIYSKLSEEGQDFYFINEIDRIEKPTPLEFYRDYVSQNKPVIIKGLIDDWKALELWNDEYLKKVLYNVDVSIAVTPDGFADAVKPIDPNNLDSEQVFVKPFEKKIKFQEYINITDSLNQDGTSKDGLVYYIQYQNNSFNLEYERLWKDISTSVSDFGKQVFGEFEVDAVNFWMGMSNAISSLHKDPYENLYAVVKGTKIFTLLPPTDYPFLYERDFKSATYVNEVSSSSPFHLVAKLDEPSFTLPWIPVDPTKPLQDNIKSGYPLIERAHPIDIQVHEGEVLYLPSLYYHRVAQKSNPSSGSNSTIAINYWFNMKYNLNYVYYQFLRNLKNFNFTKK